MLEHHADLAADLVDALEIVGELDAVDDDLARLMLLEPVDAADERRLARARRPADDDALAPIDGEIDVAQHVEFAVPLVHVDDLDRDVVRLIVRSFLRRPLRPCITPRRLWPVASRRSMKIE